MGEFRIVIALIIGLLIILFETHRFMNRSYNKSVIDFLFISNILFLICYSIIPIFLSFLDYNNLGPWYWITKISFSDKGYLIASIISLIAYISFIVGYYSPRIVIKKTKIKYKKEKIYISNWLFYFGIIIFIIGLTSLLIYFKSIGGIEVAIVYAQRFRGSHPLVESKVAFLKNFADFIIISSYIFYGYFRTYKLEKNIKYRNISFSFFIISMFFSILLLYHRAGRLAFIRYILTFPIAFMLEKNKISKTTFILFLIIIIVGVLFGDSIFIYFQNSEHINETIDSYKHNIASTIQSFLLEFSFPYINLGSIFSERYLNIKIRYFYDLILGVLYLIPKRLFNIELIETLSMTNTEYFNTSGTIPIDLLSFGFYSLSYAGIVITTFCFGKVSRFFEYTLDSYRQPILSVFKSAWLFYLPFRIMYGDAAMSFKEGFALIISTIILILYKRNYNKDLNTDKI